MGGHPDATRREMSIRAKRKSPSSCGHGALPPSKRVHDSTLGLYTVACVLHMIYKGWLQMIPSRIARASTYVYLYCSSSEFPPPLRHTQWAYLLLATRQKGTLLPHVRIVPLLQDETHVDCTRSRASTVRAGREGIATLSMSMQNLNSCTDQMRRVLHREGMKIQTRTRPAKYITHSPNGERARNVRLWVDRPRQQKKQEAYSTCPMRERGRETQRGGIQIDAE